MARKRILWLVSWYPNKTDAFDGDFIQRHARAAAVHNDIHVLFLKQGEGLQTQEDIQHYDGLVEQRIYVKSRSEFFFGIVKTMHWLNACKKAVANFVTKYGKPDVVHVHIPWRAGLIALWIKQKYKIHYIVSEHWNFYGANRPDSIHTKPLLYRKALKRIYANAQIVIPVSKFLEKEILAFSKVHQLRVIPNVVDTSLFFYDQRKNIPFTFIHVSNMVPLKNVAIILESFYLFYQQSVDKSMQLILIGNRDDEYAQQVDQWGLLNKSIFFMGELPYNEVAQQMRQAHCFVLNSNTESFSCVIAEALCCGLPVIANDTGALPELVTVDNGLLIPPANKELLAQKMKEMMERWPQFNHGDMAKEAGDKFGEAAISQQLDALYDRPVTG